MLASAVDSEPSWQPVLATVVGCRRTLDTWFVNESSPDEFGLYEWAEFLINFSYLAEGKIYRGKYRAGLPEEIGMTCEIMFDVHDPKTNTGSDRRENPFFHAVTAVVAIAIAWLLIKYFPE